MCVFFYRGELASLQNQRRIEVSSAMSASLHLGLAASTECILDLATCALSQGLLMSVIHADGVNRRDLWEVQILVWIIHADNMNVITEN